MNIVLSADENYARYASVVMASVIANAGDPGSLRFFLLTPGISHSTEEKLRASVEASGARLAILVVQAEGVETVELRRFGLAGLLRLYMHRYLPADCERVIYLDCDVVVLSDLEPLWSLPMEGYPVAAAMDLCCPAHRCARRNAEGYFNSGVMLVDLVRWRESKIAERALACLQEQGESFKYPDQDALNCVLENNWLQLGPEWNFQPTAYAAIEKRYAHLLSHLPALREAVRHPRIVHFIGAIKPWHAMCAHPLQDLFLAYSRDTPWPITKRELNAALPWAKRLRLAFKAAKLRRRRMKTER